MIEHEKENREEIIQQILAELDEKLPQPELNLVQTFIKNYYATASLDLFNAYSITDLYGSALNFWHFLSKRTRGEPKLRIYNPNDEQHGWLSTHTIVELNYDDMPFLVDSMRIEINRQGFNVHNILHFGGFFIKRDLKGEISEIIGRNGKRAEGAYPEAVIHIEIDRQTDPDILNKLEAGLLSVLEDVTASVKDWQLMRDKLQEILEDLDKHPPKASSKAEILETKDFLKWIKEDHFTFIGCRDYQLVEYHKEPALALVSGTGLGVLRNETHSKKIRLLSDIAPEIKDLVLSPKQILILTKTNTLATIHRRVYTDYIGIKRYNDKGEVIGETRFIGLYTTTAYNSDPRDIPFLRHKVDTIVAKSGLSEKGHAGKDLLNIIQTLPRDDLFHASTEELFDLSMGILQLQERRVIRLFVRKDIYGRFISCLVFVPRDNFNSELRQAMQDILFKEFNALDISFDTRFSESVLARIHFVLRVDPKKPLNYNIKEIENKLFEISKTWRDDLKEHLVDTKGEEKGLILFHHYSNAFPGAYREDFHPRYAVHDIDHIEKLSKTNQIEMTFYRLIDEPEDILRFKLFHPAQTIPLSDVIPMLENMGMRIIGERPYQIINNEGATTWINDFIMQYPEGSEQINLDAIGDIFKEAFAKVWYGLAENDGFNKLVIKAQLNWREVAILRAYAKYLRQTGFMFSQPYIETTLSSYPLVAKYLVELFNLSFNPETSKNITERVVGLEKEILAEIEKVSSLDEDRILRRYLDVLHATLRTNYFQLDVEHQPKNYISFKLNSQAIPELPLPLPAYEVFVYSPRFEAVHLRTSKVSRGGIRWSDRREDFRTEILGLMKAQKVKNAVIVPSGAKGGFVPKCLPLDGTRDEITAEAIDCYKNFMRGLLDITDNYIQGKIISPLNTICFDDYDPYLVVAADKGTASFSDIANSISKEYGFWLGDAFASGGSAGYDHKKIGITARGAWESIKRHFRELNINIAMTDHPYLADQTIGFTVIGIGDMSGDVFGNGMLLSKHIKLVAAFDHRNIFIDPNPSPEKSFTERQRLFNLPRSSWEDYDLTLISKGGGIFKRSSKSIPLTSEIKYLLGLEVDQIPPNDLIKAILTAEVELLWNGGIGTYIKATSERHADVGDRANDFVRVNGNQLRCKVLGEGGNLGCTQLGRIEYALKGGLCNTDFIDNSAGVDCSDHEVNIKILLNEMVTKSDLTEKQRNVLLASMTDEVAKLVLNDNYQQALAISLAKVHAKTHAELYRHYLFEQEKLGLIDRTLEFLPDDKTLAERKIQGISLTRPELAILLSYSKINLKADIINSDLPEDPYLARIIETAFPEKLHEKFSAQITSHSLRREIIATQLSNNIVNKMGAVFVYRIRDETGASPAEIICAYAAIYEIFNIKALHQSISEMDYQISADIQIEMLLHIKRLVRRATRWLLRNRRTNLDVEKNIQYFGAGVATLTDIIPGLMVGVTRDYMEQLTQQFIVAGLPSKIASRIAGCRAMYTALNIVDVAAENNFDLTEAAKVFFAIGAHLELAWFRDQINATSLEDYWDSLARASLRDDLDVEQRALTVSILRHHQNIKGVDERIKIWLKQYHPLLERWTIILSNMRSSTSLNFIMFFVAVRELSDITALILKGLTTRAS
jgi:glutamate dehydrogenase